MTSQLTYLIAQQRQAELVCRTEQAGLASEHHAAPLAEAPGYPPLCAHGMNPHTDRSYDIALARLRRG